MEGLSFFIATKLLKSIFQTSGQRECMFWLHCPIMWQQHYALRLLSKMSASDSYLLQLSSKQAVVLRRFMERLKRQGRLYCPRSRTEAWQHCAHFDFFNLFFVMTQIPSMSHSLINHPAINLDTSSHRHCVVKEADSYTFDVACMQTHPIPSQF